MTHYSGFLKKNGREKIFFPTKYLYIFFLSFPQWDPVEKNRGRVVEMGEGEMMCDVKISLPLGFVHEKHKNNLLLTVG